MPRKDRALLCVGQYLNSSEEEGVGDREVTTRGPGWKEGGDIRVCCPGLRLGEELSMGHLRPVCGLILER